MDKMPILNDLNRKIIMIRTTPKLLARAFPIPDTILFCQTTFI